MPESSTEKTEKATPKKRRDERKKGNVFLSKDVNTILSLVVSFYIFRVFVVTLIGKINMNYQEQIERITLLDKISSEEIIKIFFDALMLIGTTILPAMLLTSLVSVVATLFQTRGLVSGESMKFKMSRLSLLKGIKKFFSIRSLVELVKSIIKITVLGWLLYSRIQKTVSYLPSMIDWDILQALAFIGEEIMALVNSVAIAFAAIATVDYLYQWWEYEKDIKMTKQEIKDEYKQMEGDPGIKGKRRQRQMEMAQRRMMQQVKDADVIVRNPTHYAVAIKYTIDQDPAPMVLAKGADQVALRIVEEGEKHKVLTVENKSLARGLYETADIYGYIPQDFFQPVAELLAWIYTAKEKEKGNVQL